VSRIVDPQPWLARRRDEALAEIDRRAAAATTDEQRRELDADRKAVLQTYRSELRKARRIPW
jgi:hypothetical protein